MKNLLNLLNFVITKHKPSEQLISYPNSSMVNTIIASTRFCNCKIHDYEISVKYNSNLQSYYEKRKCNICDHYWEGPIK